MSSNCISLAQTRSFALCSAALVLGGCEAAITYDAMVGLNWGLLILDLTVAVLICSLRGPVRINTQQRPVVGLTILLAAALMVTSDPFWQFLVVAASVMTLSAQILLLLGARTESIGAAALASAPFKCAAGIAHECARRTEEVFAQFRAEAGLRAIRAFILALPVALVLALLLSGADPTFATWRDATTKALLQISILGRIAWFAALSGLMLGTMGLALESRPPAADVRSSQFGLRFSQTDQLAVLGSAAAVFALYLALQVSYLFGNSGAVVGSHITYAEAVHRGFIELNAATTLSTLVVIALVSRSARPLSQPSKALTVALILQSQVLAVSAFHRVRLYEIAYGYTEQRFLVGVYAGAAIVVLTLLAWEIIGAPNFLRFARRTWVIGILTLCGLVFWNHEAWIVRANLSRYRLTGQLDTSYLIYRLGPDGLPELTQSLPSLDAPLREKLENCLHLVRGNRYGRNVQYQWFEWTLRRTLLRQALEKNYSPVRANEQTPNPITCAPR